MSPHPHPPTHTSHARPQPASPDEPPIPVSVWTSTLKRTIETASYLPFPKLRWKVRGGL